MAGPELLIASTLMSAVGTVASSNAQAKSLKSQQRAAEYNATVQEQQSRANLVAGTRAESDQRSKARAVIGRQAAQQGQSGLLTTGTAADLFRRSYEEAERDALNIRYQNQVQAVQGINQQALTRYEGRAAGKAAGVARTSGLLSASSVLLSGGYKSSQARLKE